MARAAAAVGTVEVMPDLPFGFSSGEDPDRDKREGAETGGPSASDPFGFGSGDMADLGQIFTRDGLLVANVAQEGLIRQIAPKP